MELAQRRGRMEKLERHTVAEEGLSSPPQTLKISTKPAHESSLWQRCCIGRQIGKALGCAGKAGIQNTGGERVLSPKIDETHTHTRTH